MLRPFILALVLEISNQRRQEKSYVLGWGIFIHVKNSILNMSFVTKGHLYTLRLFQIPQKLRCLLSELQPSEIMKASICIAMMSGTGSRIVQLFFELCSLIFPVLEELNFSYLLKKLILSAQYYEELLTDGMTMRFRIYWVI